MDDETYLVITDEGDEYVGELEQIAKEMRKYGHGFLSDACVYLATPADNDVIAQLNALLGRPE